MKYILLIITLSTLLFSCKESEKITKDTTTVEKEIITEELPVKETLFLTMERTPCFGKCSSYKITIFNTGNIVYEGFSFVEKEGIYRKKLTTEQLSEIQNQLGVINFFELNDKYDSQVTDIPSVQLLVIYKGKKKKILDRVNGPNELREFEKLIDYLVIDDKLVKVKDKN